MQTDEFFFRLYGVDESGSDADYLGCAFPITPDGGFLTCRHVVNAALSNGKHIAINDGGELRPISDENICFPSDLTIDIAFIRRALGRPKREFFPILSSDAITPGKDVYTFGYFSFGGDFRKLESGYFRGTIVSMAVTAPDIQTVTLPFPILEGMSGSPILTYHDGVKLVALAHGNRQMRIEQQQVLEYKDTEREYRESINRIVEFGLAYHADTVVNALKEMGADGFIITHLSIKIPGIE